jgi:hypothetical protein
MMAMFGWTDPKCRRITRTSQPREARHERHG